MAIYRTVQMAFWTDAKIADNYSVEEKFLYLYCLTNPHTNLSGCYEISYRQIAFETGLTAEKVEKLVNSLQAKGTIAYNKDTAEMLVVNWSKYNWTTSEKFRKPLKAEIDNIKYSEFKDYLEKLYEYGDAEYTVISENTDTVPAKKPKKEKPVKDAYGENGNVLLTTDEYNRLCDKYGAEQTRQAIEYFDLYLTEPKNKRKYTDHNAAMRRWVFDAVAERKGRNKTTAKTTNINDYLMQQATGGML